MNASVTELISTVVLVATFLGSLSAVWAKLDKKAGIALSKASNAETKAQHVENIAVAVQRDQTTMQNELTRIRTILEERLPHRRNNPHA